MNSLRGGMGPNASWVTASESLCRDLAVTTADARSGSEAVKVLTSKTFPLRSIWTWSWFMSKPFEAVTQTFMA